MYLNSVQQMVSGELAGEGLQTGFSRHGLPPQRAPLDTVYPLREHLNSVQRRVSGGYCEGLFPDTVCWTRLRNTWVLSHTFTWQSLANASLIHSIHATTFTPFTRIVATKVGMALPSLKHWERQTWPRPWDDTGRQRSITRVGYELGLSLIHI